MNKVTKKRLLSVIDAMQEIPVLVAGDYMLDKYVWGRVDRVSPEAPVPVLAVDREEFRPGGAGNVAANIVALGGCTYAVGIVGNDTESGQLLVSLQERRIDVGGMVLSDFRPTTTKCRLVAHHQQLVRMDHEKTIPANEREIEDIHSRLDLLFPKVKAVILQDYNKGMLCESVIRSLISRCINGNIPVAVDPKLENFFRYQGVTLFKPNEKEVERALGITVQNDDDLRVAGHRLQEQIKADLLLITSGEHGMTLFIDKETVHHIPTRAQEVFDVSGAGDTVISVMSLALVAGARPAEAAFLANAAAGICVSKVGTQPVFRDELIQEITHDESLG